MLYRLNAHRPAKKVERRQSLDNARTPLGRNRGLKRPSIGWLAANRRTAPDAAFGFPAKQCAAVACSGNPSRFARPRDEVGLPVVGSAGTTHSIIKAELTRRTNTPVSMQLEVGQKTHKTIIYGTIYVSSI
jgi:hypothetical protein